MQLQFVTWEDFFGEKKKEDILQTHLWELPSAHFIDDMMPREHI